MGSDVRSHLEVRSGIRSWAIWDSIRGPTLDLRSNTGIAFDKAQLGKLKLTDQNPARCNAVQWCGAVVRCSVMLCGAVRRSVVRCNVVRRGAVRCRAVQRGAVRCDVVRCGVVRCSVVWYGSARRGAVQSGAVMCGDVW